MYFALIAVIFALASCKGEVGPPGADGLNGTDGADGNANVITISLLETDITWTEGSYLGRISNVFTLDTAVVTQDIVDHGTVLGYCNLYDDIWYALPFTWENSGGTNRQYVFHSYFLNTIQLYAYQTTGLLDPGAINEYRFLLITDNTVNKSVSGKQNILMQLENAGVDINDYYQVMDYYGLKY